MNNFVQILLFPFSLVYGIIVWIRNVLYDYKIFKSFNFSVPVISIGNITVGGTGKTPFVEYLIRLFNKKGLQIAVLSRGYKRKSKGFYWVQVESSEKMVGDEPLQIKNKFPKILVAVAENRVHGIQKIFEDEKKNKIHAILLDDAYQHRRVKPKLSILLLEYKQLVNGGYLLPMGRLREPFYQRKRANFIIVTKCPDKLSQQKRNKLKDIIGKPYEIFFSTIFYEKFNRISSSQNNIPKPNTILLVTGIANPKPLLYYLKKNIANIQLVKFPDHHNYSLKDIKKIIKCFSEIRCDNKIILTTEKDSYRLKNPELKEALSPIWNEIYYIPILIKFLNNESSIFDKKFFQLINH